MKLLTMARRWQEWKHFVTVQFARTNVPSKIPILIRALHPSEKDEMLEVLWKAFDPDPWNMWLDENAARKGKEMKTTEFYGALLNATHIDVLDDKSGIAMYQQINKRPTDPFQPVNTSSSPVIDDNPAPSQIPVKSNHAQSNLNQFGGGDQFEMFIGGSNSRQEMGVKVDAVQLEIDQQAPPPPYTYLSFLGESTIRYQHNHSTTFFQTIYSNPDSDPDQCCCFRTGVDPARKGTGAGGALLRHHLARKFELTGEEQDKNITNNSITTAAIAPVLALRSSDPANAEIPQSNTTAPGETPSQTPVLALWTSDPANVGFYEKYGLTVYR